jgi:hypothetical protein
MSAVGQKQKSNGALPSSAFLSTADLPQRSGYVSFVPTSDLCPDITLGSRLIQLTRNFRAKNIMHSAAWYQAVAVSMCLGVPSTSLAMFRKYLAGSALNSLGMSP